ncbi:MAG: hypothetical protein NTU53_15905 [Planctomycetota bacterium]|nr:hypothetical protein [Planctomycetota bacterium]
MRYAIAIMAINAMALSAGAANAPKPGANLLGNASFEERSGERKPGEPWGTGFLDGVSRSPFSHWGYGGFWDGGDYDIKLGAGHSGKLSARLVCRQKGRGGICSEAIRVAPGTKLQFKGWFKAIGAKGGQCSVNFEGEPGDGWARVDLPTKSDYEWTQVSGTVTVPVPKNSSAEAPREIHVFIYTQAYGELWMDDVSLTMVE